MHRPGATRGGAWAIVGRVVGRCQTPRVPWSAAVMDADTERRCEELAKREAAEAPPLSEDQQRRLRLIFRGRATRPVAGALRHAGAADAEPPHDCL